MHEPSDFDNNPMSELRRQVLGLGERSFRKSWYPELQSRLDELELFRALVDCTIEAILVIELVPLRITDANITATTLLQTTIEALKARPLAELVPREILEHIERKAETDRSSPLLDQWPTVGHERELETFVRFSGDSSQKYAILTVRDVTERRRLERQTLDLQRLEVVGRLAGGIAHDFNNLLGAIIGTVELVRSELPPDSPIANDLADVTFTANRAALLTRRLMTFARTGSGKEKLVNVVALVNDLMRLLVRIVGERASIVVQNDVEQIWVRAEPIALEQAVVNLVSNARDAVSVGGTILVRVRSVANNTPTEKPVFCLLEVEDDGVGMDTETQRRVFEPFFTTKPASRGTGLGLSVVANVVAHSGGRVELESEPGKGSRFRLYFPAQPPPDNAVLGIRTIMPKTVGNGRLVLVVEDERMLRENMARALQRNGFEVAVAEDLDEATFRCRRCRTAPTLLISDMVLPDGTGRDVAKILEQKWGNVPTLFVSGYIDDEVAHTTELDLKNLMPKPFTPQALLERVAQLLQDQTA